VDCTDKICGLWLYLITPIALLFYLSAEFYLNKKSETETKYISMGRKCNFNCKFQSYLI